MPQFEIILFDMDGTLVGHSDIMPQALRAVLSDAGLPPELDLRAITGNTDYQNFKAILRKSGIPEDQLEPDIMDLCHRLERKVGELLSSCEMPACPGVLDLLPQLAEIPVTLGLLTGNLEAIVAPKLTKAGIAPQYFKFGGFGDKNETRVDAARQALLNGEKFLGKKIPPSRVLVVGDTPKDIACARAIGAKVLAVATGLFSEEELLAHDPDICLDDLTDADTILNIVSGE